MTATSLFFLPTVEEFDKFEPKVKRGVLVALMRAYLHEDETNRKILKSLILAFVKKAAGDDDLAGMVWEACKLERYHRVSAPLQELVAG